ncbi:hypothetical protein C8R46DRAFT_1278373 [Mycena filopes]|nr:hypothetical protein C8R46DRAFT_1278373 [Mycena filopes]
MFTNTEFQLDSMTPSNINEDTSSPRNDPLGLPPLLFPPSPPARGRALDASFPRLPSHTRAFSHSPRPPYATSGEQPETDALPRHSYSELGLYPTSSRYDPDRLEPELEPGTAAIEEYLDASLMAQQYLDLPNNGSTMHEDPFNAAAFYAHSDSTTSSPEATDTASTSSPRTEGFSTTDSTQSSPGYLMRELPDSMNTARPGSGFGYHQHHQFVGAHRRRSSTESGRYQGRLALPRLPSFEDHAPSAHARAMNNDNWGYLPSPMPQMPSISQSSRYTVSQPPSPPAPQQGVNTFGQFPVAEDLRRWPQMFKISQVKRGGAKKQKMSCFFCRERKIGCTRPDEGEEDQTCNQCARRKRTCEYPLVSLRGQHTRNRLNSKKLLGLEDSDTPVAIDRQTLGKTLTVPLLTRRI